MEKPFRSVDDQVAILKRRGLQIEDDAAAAHFLLFNNYYNVVNHFGKFFQSSTDKYIEGATFDEIRYLFQFDKELKSLFIESCLDIEKNLKSLVSYYYSEEFQSPFSYLQRKNYEEPNKQHTKRCIEKLGQIIIQNYADCTNNAVSHYAIHHSNVPLWVLTGRMDFGMLNSFYKNMPNKIRSKVVKCFIDSYEDEYDVRVPLQPGSLWKILYAFQELRNTCAHNNRLLGHTLKYSLPFLEHVYPEGHDKSTARNSIYDAYIHMQLFLTKEQFDNLTRAIKKRMRNYLMHRIKSISYSTILESLGFPDDWID